MATDLGGYGRSGRL